ncbi:MAG: hypothetical protein ABSG68_03250 [Thermoguttaceae bacterium]|jgi:hypothetical protein
MRGSARYVLRVCWPLWLCLACHAGATGAAEVSWRIAPPADVPAAAHDWASAPSLEKLAEAAGKAAAGSAAARPAEVVVEGRWLPAGYRPLLRRYFELMNRRGR